MDTKKSYCRICGAFCAIEVDVLDNRVVKVRGDKSDPETEGYTCIKGRQIPFQMYEAGRLDGPLVKETDNSFSPVPYEEAVTDIAAHLKQIITEHGPRSVAVYCGTQGYFNSAFIPVARAWLDAIESPNYFSSMTIDCPAHFTARARAGMWAAGHQSFKTADVVLMAGRNPMVSLQHSIGGGIPGSNPGQRLKEARQRGLKLICVDPWESDIARRADIHLQVKPGEDACLFAGLIHIILAEDLHDLAFCDQWVDGLAELRLAVRDFTPERVAIRVEVPAEQLIAAARLFAAGPRGCASGGLGTEMGPNSELTQYLIYLLNVLCGRFNREGDSVENPGVFFPEAPRFEGALSKERLPEQVSFGTGVQPRVRGLQTIASEMPTNGLADEILTPGEGQIRALFCVGGNPVLSFPDTPKTISAMEALELLVCLDPFESATTAFANYVIPTKLPLERDDVTTLNDYGYEQPYSHYAPAAVTAPPGMTEEPYFIMDVAAEMGVEISIKDETLGRKQHGEKSDLLEAVTRGGRVPLSDIIAKDGGGLFPPDKTSQVMAPIAGLSGKFTANDGDMLAELDALSEYLKSKQENRTDPFPFRLIGRRLREVMNSVGMDFPVTRKRLPENPLFIHPDDLDTLGASSGDALEVQSHHGKIVAQAVADVSLKRGTIAMSHCWGKLEKGKISGASVNLLINNEVNFSKATGMPIMTGFDVNLCKIPHH